MSEGDRAVSRVSFIVPAYNEGKRLGGSLARLIAYAKQQPYTSEIIVVDDGSADETAAIAEGAGTQAGGTVSFRVLRHERNRGKGAAVRTGVLEAAGEVVLSFDADLAMPPEETPKLLDAVSGGADIAAGSRIQPGGYDMRASQPAWRRIGGRAFALVRARLVPTGIKDTQCGFKAYRREAAQAIFPRQRLEGWTFDVELLYLARKLGFSIAQVPIEWQHAEDSRFQLTAGSALREVRDLLRIRWLHRGVKRA
jgi:dolichyl-phosphate beta-glucosyltransferase